MSQLAEETYRIVHEMTSDLPALVGPEAWTALAIELAQLDAEWAAADGAWRVGVAAGYRTALAPYKLARERLAGELGAVSVYEDVLTRTAALLEQLGDIDGAAQLRRLSHAGETRYMYLKRVGEPAKSVKWRNLEFNFGVLALVAAGVLEAVETLDDTTSTELAGVTAILLLLAALYKTMERGVSVDDASVFHGLIKAGGAARQADLSAIMAATNNARDTAHLEPLTEKELARALRSLERLKAIVPVDANRWRIIEEHGQVS